MIETISAITLAGTSLFLKNSSTAVLVINSAIAAVLLPMVNGIHLSFTYIQIAEMIPTRYKGTGVALVLVFGKLFGAMTPFSIDFVKDLGLHVMVGCSHFSVLAW